MIIKLSPQRRDDALVLSKKGDVLTINGEEFDFTAIPDGATLPASAVKSEFIAGDVTRTGGTLTVPLILPHGPNPSEAVAFPADIKANADGKITLPQDPEEPEEIASDE
jgi:hypothetical protein